MKFSVLALTVLLSMNSFAQRAENGNGPGNNGAPQSKCVDFLAKTVHPDSLLGLTKETSKIQICADFTDNGQGSIELSNFEPAILAAGDVMDMLPKIKAKSRVSNKLCKLFVQDTTGVTDFKVSMEKTAALTMLGGVQAVQQRVGFENSNYVYAVEILSQVDCGF
jgi:hypothetical protein